MDRTLKRYGAVGDLLEGGQRAALLSSSSVHIHGAIAWRDLVGIMESSMEQGISTNCL